ncbi:hypothetical protein [Microbulbifer discodermiae]|uniref:hypothetical protein n=1 Tax=Microbulbifer sp. 2201CG32-9 TaxID=3232309 RepID=UPI00345C2F88
MRKTILVIAALCLVLGGCAQQQYGDFIEVEEPALVQAIANDVAGHLSDHYLVGEEGFRVDPEILGPLGLEIDAALRQRGYSVSPVNGVPLTYIFDLVDATSGPIYRLSLHVGDSYHSKAYRAEAGPGSPWTVLHAPEPEQSDKVLAQGGAQ